MGHHDWKKDRDVVDGLSDVNEKKVIAEDAVVMEEGTSMEPIVKTKRKKHLRNNRIGLLLLLIVLVVLGVAYHYKGLFVAATVNGSPISRLAVISELEKQSGSQALDALVAKKLIMMEATKRKIVVTQADIDQEIRTISDQASKQGGTLAEALAQQGMTEADLREQIMYQKELEKILGDQVVVTDDDVNQYVATNKATAPKGTSDDDFKAQIKDQLKGQKFNTAAGKWMSDAKAKATINYFADHVATPELPSLPADASAPQGQ